MEYGIVPILPAFSHTRSARCAKIEYKVRSIENFTLNIILEMFFCCEGVSSSSKNQVEIHFLLHNDEFLLFFLFNEGLRVWSFHFLRKTLYDFPTSSVRQKFYRLNIQLSFSSLWF
jgi:hypothetical protein